MDNLRTAYAEEFENSNTANDRSKISNNQQTFNFINFPNGKDNFRKNK